MQTKFKRFLEKVVGVEKRKIPYYIRWVQIFWKREGGKWGDGLLENNKQHFLKILERQVEGWQVKQAEEALSLYSYFIERTQWENIQGDKDIEKWEGCEEEMVRMLRLRHLSYRTETSYVTWIKRLREFVKGKDPYLLVSQDVENFLSYLAVEKRVSASTQNQALNAIVFFFRNVLHKEIKVDALRARGRRRLPVVLSREEIKKIISLLDMPYKLMCLLIYGSGIRLVECIRMRVKDIDIERKIIIVRSGKGDKDRVTLLPSGVLPLLQGHLQKIKELYLEDRKNDIHGVVLPGALEKKYPLAGKEWGWFWVFPSPRLSVDPRGKVIRRHHLHPVNLQKAFKIALKKAEISKGASVHSLRHSFATHLIEDGYDVRTVQELLGHKHLQTTMIYTHIAQRNILGVKSPLDAL